MLRTVGVRAKSVSLADYFRTNEEHKTDRTSDDGDNDVDNDNDADSSGPSTIAIAITMEEARRGREPLLAILEDAGIDTSDPNDVLRLPMWSSVSDLYYGTGTAGTGSSRTGSEHLPGPNQSVDGGRIERSIRPGGASVPGPVILGLERCASFRERVPWKDRYLGVAGNFNSGTTAFGTTLQKNCRLVEVETDNNNKNNKKKNSNNSKSSSSSSSNIERPPNWSYRGKRGTILSNVNGMLSEVPWAKHKPASYYRRHNGKRNNNNNNNTTIPTTPTVPQSSSVPQSSEPIVDHDSVLPVVLVRDPFYWMQSMCREGYGVRWDHDAKRHCPNLVPDASDRARAARKESRKQKQRQQQWQGEDDTLPLSTSTSSVPVWMGANPTEGQTWPSLIHYWNAWYESYYYNHDFDYYSGNDYYSSQAKDESVVGSEQRKPKRKPKLDRNRPGSNWPRLIVRFEDTLFYPSEVMAEVCHCGGGRLIGEPSSGNGNRNGGSYEQQIRHDYSLEDSKPHHRHEGKSNFVQAMVRYGTNATRLHNMTRDDIRFAVEHLNPELMKAFGYSYPSKEYYE